jgi:hypothetical protein
MGAHNPLAPPFASNRVTPGLEIPRSAMLAPLVDLRYPRCQSDSTADVRQGKDHQNEFYASPYRLDSKDKNQNENSSLQKIPTWTPGSDKANRDMGALVVSPKRQPAYALDAQGSSQREPRESAYRRVCNAGADAAEPDCFDPL